MKIKIGIYALCIILIGTLSCALYFRSVDKEAVFGPTEFEKIVAPEQTEPFVPEWAKVAEPVAVDLGENIALGKVITDNGYEDVYVAVNANDGKPATYWEGVSDAYPNQLTVDLGVNTFIAAVKLSVNPSSLWSERTQTFEILGSVDNENFERIARSTEYAYDPKTGNVVTVSFEATEVRYVRVEFTANTGAKGGQVAEFEVYGVNLAFQKAIVDNGYQDVYVAVNANDGNRNTYWEGKAKAYPNQLTVDLVNPTLVKKVTLCVNPINLWGARTQDFEVLISMDGVTFTSVVPSASYDYDPATGNQVEVGFEEIEARFVRVEFTANNGANGGQVAELEIR